MLLPSLGTKVHDLVIGVDALADTKKRVSQTLLRTLRSAICIRQRVALLFGKDDADPGHEYMILVLKYCYQRLKPLVQMETPDCGPVKTSKRNKKDSNPSLSNSFQALSTEDEPFADSETDAWDEQHVDRPDEPESVFTIDEDLIEGSDFFVAMAFLGVVDTLLGEVATAYANLKGICRQSAASRENKLGFELMKCAVVANSAIQELNKYAEQVFFAERPHLNSIYRILAAAALPGIITFFISHMDGEGEEHE